MSRAHTDPRAGEADIAAAYEALLRGWVAAAEGASLHATYEFGREMFSRGLGVLDMVTLHNRVVASILRDASPAETRHFVDIAGKALMESLAPFEMTHRGFREANLALRTSEERYRELFENANDIIFTTDLKGHLTSVNRAGLVLTGYSREEALALQVESILPPPYRDYARGIPQVKGDAPDGRTRAELEIIARDGRRIPIEVSTRLIFEDGKPTGIQGIARDITDRRQAESAMRHVNQWLEEKAKRIAHALHDEAGQLLASVYLRVAEIAADMPRQGRQRLEDLRTLLDQVDDQVRRLAHELRPTILDDLGLVPACEFLAEGVSARAQLPITVRGSTGGRLPPDVETALYRVTQEALTNASKHAKATHVTVEFQRTGTAIVGSIRDDGVGFDLPAILARLGKQGLGLMGMRERLVAVSGKLLIQSNPGQGTSIAFEVPLEH